MSSLNYFMHRRQSTCVAAPHWIANKYFLSSYSNICNSSNFSIYTNCRGFTMFSKKNFKLRALHRWKAEEMPSSTSYKLNESCKLVLQAGDITKWHVNGETDAIVNAANKRMLGGGGVDGAIHRAAGPELLAACRAIPEVEPDVRCPTGSARITKAFKLLVSHVIYTVGPVYESDEDPPNALSNAYKNSVMVAKENNIKYIAFPAISCGIYRYPPEAAAQVALSTLQEHTADLKEPLELRLSEQFLILPLDHHSNLSSLASTSASTLIPKRIVHFVLYGPDAWKAWLKESERLFEKQENCVEN
ncbi:uncharacterized protein LOC131047046 isoform X2 [Cryptomeria japonica]|uniref:uncharacterized protein LOC131047046 isoform X2 n=1 Tax=Cryptomeria japonica TaxID=3369 RepID=UPI0027DA55CB|nr:uncharacterized protein LOC131047046 isoform X2 [Cryptomeria japonica]